MKEFAPVVLVTYFALAGAVAVAALAQQRDVRSQSQSSALTSAEATKRIVTAAQALLATLDDAGRAKVQFPSTDRRKRVVEPSVGDLSATRACGWAI